MLEFETLVGWRVVASPEALDRLGRPGDDGTQAVLRLAPDDAFVIEGVQPETGDPDQIVVAETGFAGSWLSEAGFDSHVRPHIEWTLPNDRSTVAQGSIAGVPAKVTFLDNRWLLFCAAPYADELRERLR